MPAGTHEADEKAEENRKPLERLEDLRAIGTAPGGAQERDPFEFPERPRL